MVAVLENIFSSILIHIRCMNKCDEYGISFNIQCIIAVKPEFKRVKCSVTFIYFSGFTHNDTTVLLVLFII